MRIAIDAMGGDHGPAEAVRAAAVISRTEQSPSLLLVGDRDLLGHELQLVEHDHDKIAIQHAAQVIEMHDSPGEAIAAKPDASVIVAARAVAGREADALVSCGNTGALLIASGRLIGRIEGVRRAALAAVIPTETRRGEKQDPFALMLDVGATLDVDASDLVAFAVMGHAYAARIGRNPRPRVALLANGSEPHKGSAAIVEAHQLLASRRDLDFIGNIEGVDIPAGIADVIVTGGFVGNVVLKMLEGVSATVMRLARYAYRTKLTWKIGLWMLASGIRRLKQFTDWQQYGGAPILGLNQVCIKAHGRSRERAIGNAIKVATRAVRTDLVGAIRSGVNKASR